MDKKLESNPLSEEGNENLEIKSEKHIQSENSLKDSMSSVTEEKLSTGDDTNMNQSGNSTVNTIGNQDQTSSKSNTLVEIENKKEQVKSPIREDQIQIAVQFLTKVISAPKDKKIEFLKSKGLSMEEINIAFSILKSFKQMVYNNSKNLSKTQIIIQDIQKSEGLDLNSVNESVKELARDVRQAVYYPSEGRSASQKDVQAIKSEIRSLKGILLSRRNFPTTSVSG
ncbi:hypothetical protein HDV02_003846 [Globomyces sp. JEL0801]|nr:hypothetical protein HDV02_003846 [Globomyces sp. JEL0801]